MTTKSPHVFYKHPGLMIIKHFYRSTCTKNLLGLDLLDVKVVKERGWKRAGLG
jgi:hypothetical protein